MDLFLATRPPFPAKPMAFYAARLDDLAQLRVDALQRISVIGGVLRLGPAVRIAKVVRQPSIRSTRRRRRTSGQE